MADDDSIKMTAEPGEDAEEPNYEPWVLIQQQTFINWINEKLKVLDLEVNNIRADFKDGVKLCRLMEVLMGRSIGRVKQKESLNYYEASSNLALALLAMQKDGVRLVNIGAEDIVSGNTKLILGMVWTLIRRYQLGSQSKLQPKRLMLSWCNAVLYPHVTVNNFSTDWNDGLALHGIIEYCKPGTCPDWHRLNRSDRLANCTNAMQLAGDLFGIPQVISPENCASDHLDELSGMTYLSYFMVEGSPGYSATMNWLKQQIPSTPVSNFHNDWNNGYVLSDLVKSLNCDIPSLPDPDNSNWSATCQQVMEISESQLGVKPVLTADEMSSSKVDHIGIMAYVAWHRIPATLQTETKLASMENSSNHPLEPLIITTPPPPPPLNNEPSDSPEQTLPTPPPSDGTIPPPPPAFAFPPPPSTPPPEDAVNVSQASTSTVIHTDDTPPEVKVTFVANWKINAPTNFTVDTSGTHSNDVTAIARAPSGKIEDLVVSNVDENLHHLTFTPDEKGIWLIDTFCGKQAVVGSPFRVNVYDTSQARIMNNAELGGLHTIYSFQVDCHQVGLPSDLDVYVTYNDMEVSEEVTLLANDLYRVEFTPEQAGIYNVSAHCGQVEIPGSPFEVDIRDVNSLRAHGSGLETAHTGLEAEFEVNASDFPIKNLVALIKDPSNEGVHTEIKYEMNGIIKVFYTPQISGQHKIELTFGGLAVPGNPHHVDVKQSRIYINDLQQVAYVGKMSRFEIDASEMSKGTIEIDSDLPVHRYEKIADRIYKVTFVPKNRGKHDLVIKYNNHIVEGSPYAVEVVVEGEE